jgi:hypothetical protein
MGLKSTQLSRREVTVAKRRLQTRRSTRVVEPKELKKLIEEGRRLSNKVKADMKPLFRLTETVVKLRFQ